MINAYGKSDQKKFMEETRDIITLEDIKTLVNTFYEKVKQDELLAPIFSQKIQDRWQQHLEKMYAFWQTVLLDEQAYFGNPFQPHAQLPVSHSHFQRWMELFTAAVDTLFEGEKAKEAKWRAGKMAEMFESKIEYNRNRRFKSLL
jgi:hemoglobin